MACVCQCVGRGRDIECMVLSFEVFKIVFMCASFFTLVMLNKLRCHTHF